MRLAHRGWAELGSSENGRAQGYPRPRGHGDGDPGAGPEGRDDGTLTAGGTATLVADYMLSSTTITIATGRTAGTAVIRAAMAEAGWILRSGAAQRADSAFEAAARDAGGRLRDLDSLEPLQRPHAGRRSQRPHRDATTTSTVRIAAKRHPCWDHLGPGAQKLMVRNVHQIVGQDPAEPADVDIVICWTDAGLGTGGTGTTALRLAVDHCIPIVTLARTARRSHGVSVVCGEPEPQLIPVRENRHRRGSQGRGGLARSAGFRLLQPAPRAERRCGRSSSRSASCCERSGSTSGARSRTRPHTRSSARPRTRRSVTDGRATHRPHGARERDLLHAHPWSPSAMSLSRPYSRAPVASLTTFRPSATPLHHLRSTLHARTAPRPPSRPPRSASTAPQVHVPNLHTDFLAAVLGDRPPLGPRDTTPAAVVDLDFKPPFDLRILQALKKIPAPPREARRHPRRSVRTEESAPMYCSAIVRRRAPLASSNARSIPRDKHVRLHRRTISSDARRRLPALKNRVCKLRPRSIRFSNLALRLPSLFPENERQQFHVEPGISNEFLVEQHRWPVKIQEFR